jgi:hypothetical protein
MRSNLTKIENTADLSKNFPTFADILNKNNNIKNSAQS